MGYYTQYSLSIIEGEQIDIEVAEALLADTSGYVAPTDGEAIKWYEHENDMKWLSEQYPNTTFCLSGEGEEAGDLWKKYFRNGKMQVCRGVIQFDPYNPKKLS